MTEIEELNNEIIQLQTALHDQNSEFRRYKMLKRSEDGKSKQLAIKLQTQIKQSGALNEELSATKAKLDRFRMDASKSFCDLSFVQSEIAVNESYLFQC